MTKQYLALWTVSGKGLALCQRIKNLLSVDPWIPRHTLPRYAIDIYAPERLCQNTARPFGSLSESLAATFSDYCGHIFVGACGIAVRILAPLLIHKQVDPAFVVLDNQGAFVISLLSGHLGGANALTRHLASLLNATPVITTASDLLSPPVPSIDILARNAGLTVLDWDLLPFFQNCLLEGKNLGLYDPCRCLQQPIPRGLLPRYSCPDEKTSQLPVITVHWRHIEKQPSRLRLVISHLVLGVGCRKDTEPNLLRKAFDSLCKEYMIARDAFRALATVEEKKNEPCILRLAEILHLPLLTFSSQNLALTTTPHPSKKAGERFSTPPFSVSEAAALLGAGSFHDDPVLILSKITYFKKLTLAVGGSNAFMQSEPNEIHPFT